MNRSDKFNRDRAYESRAWLYSQEYKNQLLLDKELRAKRDRALGHTPECTLTKCAPQCIRSK